MVCMSVSLHEVLKYTTALCALEAACLLVCVCAKDVHACFICSVVCAQTVSHVGATGTVHWTLTETSVVLRPC